MSSEAERFSPDGSVRWGCPRDVGHLIAQLKTFDEEMKVSGVTFIDIEGGRKARAYGLSLSRERWDASGWLNFKLPGPECLALWASTREESFWRCFHCGFETIHRAEAAAHFGDDDDGQPICLDWMKLNADERIAAYQGVIKELDAERDENTRLRERAESLEHRVNGIEAEVGSRFKGCRTVNEAWCQFDSMEGRALLAEQRLREWNGYRPLFQWNGPDPLAFVIEFWYFKFIYDLNGWRFLRREVGVVPPAYKRVFGSAYEKERSGSFGSRRS